MKRIIIAAVFLSMFFSLSFAGKDDMDLVNKGLALFKAGQYQDSIDVFEQALYINPDNFYASQYSGMAYLKIGNEESALLQFERSYYVNPSPKVKKLIDQLKTRVRGAGAFILYPVTFEVSAALNISMFYGRNVDIYSMIFSQYSLGLEGFVSYHFTEWLCLTGGFMYDEKTGSITESSGYGYSWAYKGTYLDIPAMVDFRIKTPFSDNAEISVELGGYLGLITAATYTPGYTGDPPIADAGKNRTETGLAFGTGAYYYFGKIAVSFKEVMLVGLTNVHNDYDAKTMLFMTTMGVAF